MTERGPGPDLPLRVLHLVGSAVDDFHADLSYLYATGCLRATADPAHHTDHVAWVEPGGAWRFPTELTRAAVAAAPAMSLPQALAHVGELAPDAVVPQMFCRPGMTTYRALLELLGVPVVGNPADVMALATDKARTRAVVAAAGVGVPAGQVLRPGETSTTLPLPVVVKPVDADNSDGVALVRTSAELGPAVAAAFRHGGEVLVEDYVPPGREVRCGVLERDGGLVCLPLEEYAVDASTPVRLPDDKLRREPDGELALVAKTGARAWIVDPADPVVAAVHDAARTAHRALGCRDYSLFDFRVDPQGGVWFLEAGLYCSFARQSVIPTMAAALGLTPADLLRDALERALSRSRGRRPRAAGRGTPAPPAARRAPGRR